MSAQLCKDGGMKARKRDLRTIGGTRGEGKGANEQRERGGKERVYARVENEEGQRAYRIQIRQRIE